MGFALCPLLSEGALGALNAYASPELRETYVKRLASGEWTGTMNLTEPQAGSDLNAVRTRAERAGDGTYQGVRPENLHHLWRARLRRQHRASRAGAAARRAAGHARHLAVPRAEIPGQARRLARPAQRRALRLDRAQARHPRLADLRDGLRRRRRRDRLSRRRGEPRPRRDVRDDELGPAQRRPARRRHRRTRLSARRGLRARAPPGPRRRGAGHEPDRRASRRAAHVADDEGASCRRRAESAILPASPSTCRATPPRRRRATPRPSGRRC